MMRERIKGIALCGGIRSGKDTIADYLVANHGFQRFAFGDGIRELCGKYFPVLTAQGKPRALLQGVGQDMRKYDPEIWVRWMFTEINAAEYAKYLDEGPGYQLRAVISDMRQPNEYEALRAAGFMIVRVNASRGVRINRAVMSGDQFNLADFDHETESHYEKFVPDYEITNEGAVGEFYKQIQAFAAFLEPGGVSNGIR